MIRILLLVGLLSGVLSAEAQFMKVLDPDGFVNIREEPNVKSKIVGKVNSHAVVYHLEADGMSGNWVSVTFRENGKELEGYIHASRLKVLSQLAPVPLLASDQTHWLFKSPKGKGTTADVSVRVEFDNTSHNALNGKLKLDENGDITLNGVPVWGLYDPNVKGSRYKSIEVEIGGRKTRVPAKELETLFSVGEDLQHGSRFPMLITYDKECDALYIGSSNGDTSYAYDVLFVFVAGKFKERLVYIPF